MRRWTAKSVADQEVQKHLEDARRALQKALAVCGNIEKGRDPLTASRDGILDRREVLRRIQEKEALDRAQAQRARRVAASLKGVLNALDNVGSLQVNGSEDPDLTPEALREVLDRKAPRQKDQKKPAQARREVVSDGSDE